MLVDALVDGGELRIDALGRLWIEGLWHLSFPRKRESTDAAAFSGRLPGRGEVEPTQPPDSLTAAKAAADNHLPSPMHPAGE